MSRKYLDLPFYSSQITRLTRNKRTHFPHRDRNAISTRRKIRLGRRLLPLIQVENTLSLRGSVLWLSTTNHPLHSPFPIHPRPPYLTPLPRDFPYPVCVCSWIREYICTPCVRVVVCQLFLVWPRRRCIERREKKREKEKRLISRRLFFTLAKRRVVEASRW